MKLERLAYVSHSTVPAVSLMAVSDILEQSMLNNRANNITGALAFTRSRFAQVLEGSTGSIDVLLLKLAMDPRHHGIVILDRFHIERRLFPKWAMIAPTFTPAGKTRLSAVLAEAEPAMADLTSLLLEMLDEQERVSQSTR